MVYKPSADEIFKLFSASQRFFSDKLWNALIDHATVYHDDRIVFSFMNGTDISVDI